MNEIDTVREALGYTDLNQAIPDVLAATALAALDALEARLAQAERQLKAEAGWTANDLARERVLKARLTQTEEALREWDAAWLALSGHPDLPESIRAMMARRRAALAGESRKTHGRGCQCTPCRAEDWDAVDAALAGEKM